MQRIEITIASDGQTKLETHGYSGSACREASRPLIEALGLATNDRSTADFYQRNSNTERTHQQ